MLHCEANSWSSNYILLKKKKSLELKSGHHFHDLQSYNASESGKIDPTTPAERQG